MIQRIATIDHSWIRWRFKAVDKLSKVIDDAEQYEVISSYYVVRVAVFGEIFCGRYFLDILIEDCPYLR
jgi:hypothetical protein